MQRKLTAILSADVVGYSGLMEVDEAGTLQKLKDNRARIFDPHVSIHGGRLFKLMGDGALVEFPSVIAAVECALAVQDATEKAASGAADGKPIRYRIGINLGEVITDGDDIYGDGVNVAARIQALAPVGGVAMSKMVRDSVDGKMACTLEDLGEHSVKNIERPVHVFGVRKAAAAGQPEKSAPDQAHHLSICVLPFANISDDPQQEYFSDGISEDIITDLSKVSALFVVSRNNSFMYKGKTVDIPKVARELKVSHILEGSVRKSGNRVRITAQLIEGNTGGHVWAERYDRDLNDIFALQDEISEAIVKALKLKLLPEEKKAIEKRGTSNVDAYNLYLMARQNYIIGKEGDRRRNQTVIRMCERAVQMDPDYANAWALLALGQFNERSTYGGRGDGGLATAQRALALNADLAEAHAVMARIFFEDGRADEASSEIQTALRLDPESYEVNKAAARLCFGQRNLDDAIRYWEKAISLMDTDFASAGMLVTCYSARSDKQAIRRAAEITVERVERVLALDGNNGAAMGHGSIALAVLGEKDRAKEWMNLALLVDPDNMEMRYNFACAFALHMNEKDAAIEMLSPVFKNIGSGFLDHAKVDPDLDTIRADPRFQAMLAAAEARVAKEAQSGES